MANFYCEYCGLKFPTIQALTGTSCYHHAAGWNKGKHKLYEGSEKSQYLCKYCGKKYSSLTQLTSCSCSKSPTGRHSPAK